MITDLREFNAVGLRLLDALRCRIDPEGHSQCGEFLYVGEQGLFIDWLAEVLEYEQVAITPAERDTVRDLLGYFTVDPNNEDRARAYPYIWDRDRVIGVLNVVGEP